ncbi:MAG: hypothetical protein IIA67_06445 [Planctomycetes bacterium]|nr:hypothetical protein [Planctomycetota bacterium]
MTTIFVSGLSTSSDSSDTSSTSDQPGVHQMADDIPQAMKDKIGPIKKLVWDEQDEACAFIEGAIGSERNQPVILIGHSFGGDSVVEIAEMLKEKGICVDLMIQIDSVGAFDEEKPDNVEKGVNIWSTSGDGIDGANNVSGSENIPVAGTSHTGIDDPDDDGAVNDSDSPHDGKNAFELVQDFIDGLTEPYYNERLATEAKVSSVTPHQEAVLVAVRTAGEEGISVLDLQKVTRVELQHLVPAIRLLTSDCSIVKATGPLRMQYFVPGEQTPHKLKGNAKSSG